MTRQLGFDKAIREALEEEMRENERVFIMGQNLHSSVSGVTDGMYNEFGLERVLETPISENGYCGIAVGASLMGYRPIVEIKYSDFTLNVADSIGNQASKYRYMSGGGDFKVPLVIRVCGSGIDNGGDVHTSHSLEAIFSIFPGLKIISPSTPYDAKGLLKSAIRDENPILFFEHQMVSATTGEVPEETYTIPIGKAVVKKHGNDVTIVSFSYGLIKSLIASKNLSDEGIDVEVIDLRTIKPLDLETIINSIKKTNKLIIVEEGYKTNGVGAEVSALVAEYGLEFLNGPIKRVACKDIPIPAGKYGEKYVVPSVEEICDVVKQLVHGGI